jgi:preprotein translocase subunit YajC
MQTFNTLAAAALMLAAAPALAQAPAAVTAAPAAAVAAGQTVHDTAGGVVGKIDKIEGQVAVVATGKNSVGLPLTSFAMGANGPIISMTRDQLDAAAASAAADAAAKDAAKITAGATVSDTAGGAVGTIKAVEGGFALLDTSAVQVKLPLASFAVKGDGLIVGMTKAQIEAAASASTPAAAPAAR